MSSRAVTLATALGLALAGCSAPSTPETDDASGPAPGAPSAVAGEPTVPASPTFTRDVAPILHDNCVVCHRPGQSAPFSLLDWEEVERRARRIAAVTGRRFMPPWLPEPGHGEFVGERRLDENEIETIRRWVEQGAVQGDPADMPEPPEFPDGWLLGEPDLVVEMPEAWTLPAEGTDVFRNFVIPVPGRISRFVRAVDLRPGNPKIVHHAMVTVDHSASSRRLDELDPGPGFYTRMDLFSQAQNPDGHFIGWTPGKVPQEGREDVAWQLRGGTDLVLQLHMLPTGEPEPIRASIGLYFADRPPTRDSYVLRLGPTTIDIPPGEPRHPIEDSYVLPVDLEVFAVYPHAHYLGKEMKGFATLPDGTTEWLIRIDDWDFNQQDFYVLEEPLFLPAGTELTMQFTYDNTADNPHNPHDPPRRVVYGPKSSDEMGDLWIQVLPGNRRDLDTLVEDFQVKEIEADLAGTRKSVEENPDNAAERTALGRLLRHLGRTEEAVAEYQTALRLDPGAVGARIDLGIIFMRRGRTAEAIRHLREAIRLNPGAANAHNNLGMALAAESRAVEAVAAFRQAVDLDPRLWQAHDNLGTALAAQGRLDEAVAQYRRALSIRPEDPELHNNLGGALGSQGLHREAADEFRLALQLDPDNAAAHNNLGLSLELQGQLEEAIEHYQEALRLRPDYPQARANLDRALSRR